MQQLPCLISIVVALYVSPHVSQANESEGLKRALAERQAALQALQAEREQMQQLEHALQALLACRDAQLSEFTQARALLLSKSGQGLWGQDAGSQVQVRQAGRHQCLNWLGA